MQTLFVTFQLLLIFGTDRQQGSTNPALSKQSPDILDVVFVHPPSSRTYHDFLVKEKHLRARVFKLECWLIKQNALLWRKANKAALQLEGREKNSVTLSVRCYSPYGSSV